MSDFKYFSPKTDRRLFFDSESGAEGIKEDFVHDLDKLREACGFPFSITSGYRSPEHSKERIKAKPGQHTFGHAADIAVSGGVQRLSVVEHAIKLGFTGIGVAKTFVHVDERATTRVLWVY